MEEPQKTVTDLAPEEQKSVNDQVSPEQQKPVNDKVNPVKPAPEPENFYKTHKQDMVNVEELKDQGRKLVAQGKWQEAHDLYTKILNTKSASEQDITIALSNRSYTLYMLGKYEDAKMDGMRCCKIRPAWVKGYMRVGNAALALTDITTAVKFFKGGMGKEGDDGFMKKKVNELFIEVHAPNRILKTNYYYPELVEFKQCFFSDSDKANSIYEKLLTNRGKVANNEELEKVVEEMNQITYRTWNFRNLAETFEKEKRFYLSNLCYKVEIDFSDGKNKKEIIEHMKKNNEKEEIAYPEKQINNLALREIPVFEHAIDLKVIVDILQRNILENYYDGVLFPYYYLDEVNKGEMEWVLSKSYAEKNTSETFYKTDKKKSVDYYWKFFSMNAGSFFNGALANIIDELNRNDVYPYFKYTNPETKGFETVNVLASTIMDGVVVKRFKNPTVYYPEKQGWYKMIKGKKLGKPFLAMDSAVPLVCLITDRIVYKKRLYLVVDLAAPQYDIFEYNDNGLPYYEKTMLAGDYKVEGNYYVGSCAQSIETHVEPIMREDKSFMYFPLKAWTTVLTDTLKEVKEKLGIYAKAKDNK